MQLNYKAIFAIFLFSFPLSLLAQKAQLRGVVVDAETKSPIVGASVALLSQRTNAYIRGEQTETDGAFQIAEIDANTYAIQITYVGYRDEIRQDIVISAGQNLDVGTIEIREEDNVIDEVVIEGRTPEMQIGIDRKIFDVSQSMVSVGGTAQDLLANVPTLQVDQDGSVSLRGSSSVRIFIDGKESSMAGSDINALLQSLPAEVIDKVELITNPSAKYDAEGQSGIINIVLKKNARIGFNGSANVSGGSFGNAMAGITLNYRNQKFNHFGNYNFNRRVNVGDGFNDNIRYVDGQITPESERTYNESESRREGQNHTLRLGTDYYLSDQTTLSLAGNLSLRSNDRRQDFWFQYFNNLPDLGASSERASQQYEDDFGMDVQFDFRHEFSRPGEELLGNFSFGYDTEDGTNDFNQTFAGTRPDFYRNNVTTEMGRNYNVQLDYVLPFEEDHKFEAGYRSIIRNSEDTQFSEFAEGGAPLIPDYRVSNEFELESAVHALYVNYQRQLTSRIGAQLGVRAEKMDLVSRYYDVNPDTPPNERVTEGGIDFLRLFPSAFLTYGIGEGQDKIQLSYSRRVQRPRGWQINPFLNVSDETNIRQGNPNLMPEDIHVAEIGYAKFYDRWNFVSSLFYRRVNDRTLPYLYDPELIADLIPETTGNVTYSRWENVSNANSFGLELISKVDLTNWWDVTGNVNLFHQTERANAGFDFEEVQNFLWDGNLTTNIRLPLNFSAQMRGDYRSGRQTPQGELKSIWGVDAAIRKDFMRRRASVMVNARDLFNSRLFEREAFLPQFQSSMANRRNRRTIMVTFTYNFGFRDIFGRNDGRDEPPVPIDEEGVEF